MSQQPSSGATRAALATFLLTLAWAAEAGAFCRTTRCNLGGLGSRCTPSQPDESADCDLPLQWRDRCVGFSIQRDGSRSIAAALAGDLVTRAFESWMNADCGGGARPSIVLKRQSDVQCSKLEHGIHGGNANVVIFRDNGWPHDAVREALGLTTMWFDIATGEIVGVDIEINTSDFTFTTGDTDVGFDLLSTLQHETGHFLGLAHSPHADATMFASPRHGSIAGRQLSADDVAAICAAYPPAEAALAPTCEPVPRDFSPTCSGDAPDTSSSGDGGCSVAPRARAGRSLLVAALAAATAAALAGWGRGRRRCGQA